jgi:hypothetical protein
MKRLNLTLHSLAKPRMPALDQPAFNRKRLKAEKLIDSKVLEQLIRVQVDAGCSSVSSAQDQSGRQSLAEQTDAF